MSWPGKTGARKPLLYMQLAAAVGEGEVCEVVGELVLQSFKADKALWRSALPLMNSHQIILACFWKSWLVSSLCVLKIKVVTFLNKSMVCMKNNMFLFLSLYRFVFDYLESSLFHFRAFFSFAKKCKENWYFWFNVGKFIFSVVICGYVVVNDDLSQYYSLVSFHSRNIWAGCFCE